MISNSSLSFSQKFSLANLKNRKKHGTKETIVPCFYKRAFTKKPPAL
ncbi:hypothetical protein B4096_1295 [Heyndrickxia coagulans]|nr:hypothetical protein B4096_1295 [Heyndrickxia coagulans]